MPNILRRIIAAVVAQTATFAGENDDLEELATVGANVLASCLLGVMDGAMLLPLTAATGESEGELLVPAIGKYEGESLVPAIGEDEGESLVAGMVVALGESVSLVVALLGANEGAVRFVATGAGVVVVVPFVGAGANGALGKGAIGVLGAKGV